MKTRLNSLRLSLAGLSEGAFSAWRTPRLLITAGSCLAVGIGANVVAFTAVDWLFFHAPGGIAAPKRVVRVYFSDAFPGSPAVTTGHTSYPTYTSLRERSPNLAAYAAYSTEIVEFGSGLSARRVSAALVSDNYFRLLGVSPLLGRFFVDDREREGSTVRAAVLGASFWRGSFNHRRDVLGATITIGGTVYTVIGVAPDDFSGVEPEPVELWLPLSAAGDDFYGHGWKEVKQNYHLRVVARLLGKVSSKQAASVASQVYRDGQLDVSSRSADSHLVLLAPLQVGRGPMRPVSAKVSLWLLGVSLALLLITCANLANLLLTRVIDRSHVLAIRMVLGASPHRISGYVVGESLAISGVGGAIAVVLGIAAWSPIRSLFVPIARVGPGAVTARVVAATLIVTLFGAAVAALLPIVRLHGSALTTELKAGPQLRGGGSDSFRYALLVSQVALTMILLVGAGLFSRSFARLRAIDLGFDPDHLLVASVALDKIGKSPAYIDAAFEEFRQVATRVPGVAGTSIAFTSPLGGAIGYSVFTADQVRPVELPGVGSPVVNGVSTEYLSVLGMRLREGRWFTLSDRGGSANVAVVNLLFSRVAWPGQSAIGKCIKLGERFAECTTVVGVVDDTRLFQLVEDPRLQFYLPLAQAKTFASTRTLIVRTTGSSAAVIESLRRTLQTIMSDMPFVAIEPIGNRIANRLRPWRLGAALFSAFAFLATCEAAIGLYGVLSYLVTRREHELGVRLALGATPASLRAFVVWQGLRYVSIGIGFGSVGAVALGQGLAGLLYGVSPTDPKAFFIAIGVFVTTAVLATWVPAYRAAKVDPIALLRAQ